MSLEFTSEDKAEIQRILDRYPEKEQRAAALLPVLHLTQNRFGCLSIDAQLLVAKELDVPPVRVREVVTFYEMFHEHHEGQFHLELCTNIACHLTGGDELMNHCKQKLGIPIGGKTEDGLFSLMEAECLGSCGSGPVMKVGEDYYEGLTVAAIDALIDRFKKEAPDLKGKAYTFSAKDGPHVGPVDGFEPPEGKPTGRPPEPEPAPVVADPVAEDVPIPEVVSVPKEEKSPAISDPAEKKAEEEKVEAKDEKEAEAEDKKPEEAKAEEGKAEEGKAEEAKAEEEAKPDEDEKQEAKPEDEKQEAKPEDEKKEEQEAKADEKKEDAETPSEEKAPEKSEEGDLKIEQAVEVKHPTGPALPTFEPPPLKKKDEEESKSSDGSSDG